MEAPDPSRGRNRLIGLLSDDRLARRASRGDQRAFEEIFERYHQDLYRFCLALLGNPEDAQDALQNTMVKVLRALPGETRRIRLKPWIYRIARNEAIDALRKRRESAEMDPECMPSGRETAETAEAREHLRRLIADLAALPERQRAALVMRELAGLEFAEIGSAFETSAAVARQTVYEGRLGLRQMEAGREMRCEAVTRELSEADGRIMRRRDIQAHLRACPGCRAFQDGMTRRRGELGALAPLPLAGSAAVLQGVLGAAGQGAAGGGLAGAAGGLAGTAAAGGGKVVAGSVLAKSAATVAVAAAVGAGAGVADRGGLVDLPLPGPDREKSVRIAPLAPGSATPVSSAPGRGAGRAKGTDLAMKARAQGRRPPAGWGDGSVGQPAQAPTAWTESGEEQPAADAPEEAHGRPKGLPPASSYGQQRAAERSGQGPGRKEGHKKGAAAERGAPSQRSAPGKGKPSPPAHSNAAKPAAPEHVVPPGQVRPDNPPGPPFHPSDPPSSQGNPPGGDYPSKEAR